MAQFASATFTGTAGDELTVADGNWTRHSSSSTGCNLVITDANAVRTGGSNGAAVYYHSGTPASADYSANVDITRPSALNTAAGPTVRHNTSATTFYLSRYDVADDTWRLYKAVAGTFTQLGSSVSASFSNGQTKNLKLEAIGSAIKAYADGAGAATISVTDTSITAAGQAGLRYGFGGAPVATDSTGLHLDNFSADDASGGATTYTATASLSAAIQQANTATASLSAAIQIARTASASADAAVQVSHTASASADAVILQAFTASASLDAAVQYAGAATTSLNAAIQQAHAATASVDAYILDVGTPTVTASLNAVIQQARTATASLNAAIQQARSASAGIDAAIATGGTATSSVNGVIQAAHAATASLSAAVQAAQSATASLNAYVSTGESPAVLSTPRQSTSNIATGTRTNLTTALRSNTQTARRPRT